MGMRFWVSLSALIACKALSSGDPAGINRCATWAPALTDVNRRRMTSARRMPHLRLARLGDRHPISAEGPWQAPILLSLGHGQVSWATPMTVPIIPFTCDTGMLGSADAVA